MNQSIREHGTRTRYHLTTSSKFLILKKYKFIQIYFMSENKHKLQGFTLIEILVVVALIAILAAVTIVAINPGKNFADTRNATRSADVTAILNGVTQYTSEEGHTLAQLGTMVACDPGPATEIGGGAGQVDLDLNLVDEYLVAIPIDPQDTGGYIDGSGYTICETGTGRVQIDAPTAENGKTISVMR